MHQTPKREPSSCRAHGIHPLDAPALARTGSPLLELKIAWDGGGILKVSVSSIGILVNGKHHPPTTVAPSKSYHDHVSE
jgi:hypothetical protein